MGGYHSLIYECTLWGRLHHVYLTLIVLPIHVHNYQKKEQHKIVTTGLVTPSAQSSGFVSVLALKKVEEKNSAFAN